jgi:hypothetical protein
MKSRLTQMLGNTVPLETVVLPYLFKKKLYYWTGVLALLAVMVFPACINPCNPPPVIIIATINIAEIPGVTIPAMGGTPVTAITETEQYTGTVTWSPAVSGTFAASTVYTATITINPKPGYILYGVPDNFFTVAGAAASNAANSGVVTAVFIATGTIPTYDITMEDDGNGTAAAAPHSAEEGMTITISAAPHNGYRFKEWQAVSGGAALSPNTTTPATFTMPGSAVTIRALFEELPPDTPNLSLSPVHYAVTFGYTQPVAQTVTITNTGTGPATVTNIALSGVNAALFTLDGHNSIPAIAADGDTANFTVQPGANLAVGTYTAVITATYDGGKTAATYVSFTVNPAAVNIAAIQGVTVPATDGTPVTAIIETAQYSGTVTWSPTVAGTFAAGTPYTATITLAAKDGYTFTGVRADFFTVAGATATNAANSGVVTAVFPVTGLITITIPVIQGVTVPATGGTPVTSIIENAQYSGTITWSPTVTGTFDGGTPYTATITLAAKFPYTFQGVPADFFTVTGATATNAANSDVVTAVFPATALITVTIAAIQGVTVPVTGGTPVTTIIENAQYSGTVTWSPTVTGTFAAGTQYTATITLVAKFPYTFQGVPANFFTVAGATTVTNPANSNVVTAVFPATDLITVTIAEIPDEFVPATGEPPATIIETEQYTGTVTWSPTVTGTFDPGTSYTATITLTAKFPYTLDGLPADFFTVTGATSVSMSGNVVTAEFPATEQIVIYHVWVSRNGGSDMPFDNLKEALDSITSTGSYRVKIGENQSLEPYTFAFTGKWDITLIGYNQMIPAATAITVELTATGSLFTVDSDMKLTLDNGVTLQGRNNNDAPLVQVNADGELVMKNGSVVTGNTGGGVRVVGGTFTMEGGKISANETGSYGGGVYVFSGEFTMSGGEISGNGSDHSGGGVRVRSGTFTMSGGKISGNTANTGGGVDIGEAGAFTMSSGEISGNRAHVHYGGGVSVIGGSFNKTGGTITGYTSDPVNGNVVKDTSGVVQSNLGHAVYAAPHGSSNTEIKRKENTAGPADNLVFNGEVSPPTSSGAWEN